MGTERRKERMRFVLERRQPDLAVVMENIHDPHNVSAVLRSCDAVGVFQVELLYTVERFPRLGRKSSSSANKWIAVKKHTAVQSCFSDLRSRGFKIYTSHIDATACSLYDLDLTGPVALVFGNEHRGLSAEATEHADGSFRIPMMGMIQSLNASVACAVTLYEVLRQRMQRGDYARPKFTDEELHRILGEWLAK